MKKSLSLLIAIIGGIQATPENVIRNIYFFWTIEHIYTQENYFNLTNAFIQSTTSDGVKALMSHLSYLPFSEMPSATIHQHPGSKFRIILCTTLILLKNPIMEPILYFGTLRSIVFFA